MKLTEFKPFHPALLLHVDRYSLLEVEMQTDAMNWEKCIPDGLIKLYFFEKDTKEMYADEKGNLIQWQDGVGGHPLNQNSFVRIPKGSHRFLWVNMRPSFFFQLFKVPIITLNNSVISLDSILGKEGMELKERLWTLSHPLAMVHLLDAFFVSKLAKNAHVLPKMSVIQNAILAKKGNVDIGEIAKEERTSIRTLQRKFQEEIGLGPKHYARIARFNHVSKLIRDHSKPLNWQDVIHECGYYDQSHFIHDVKSVTGEAPSLYFTELCHIADLHVGR